MGFMIGRKLMRILNWKLINQRICVIYIIKANFKILALSMPIHRKSNDERNVFYVGKSM